MCSSPGCTSRREKSIECLSTRGGVPVLKRRIDTPASASERVSAAAGRVRILGAELTLHAMDRDTLIVTGRIAAVEYA